MNPTDPPAPFRRTRTDPVHDELVAYWDRIANDPEPLRHTVERRGPEWVEALRVITSVAVLFDLPPPASIAMYERLPVEMQFSTGELTAVDDWAVALVLPAPVLHEQILQSPDPWRKYGAEGERHGHRFEVWTSKRVPK